MRTNNIIFGAALAMLSLVSCTQKMEYNRVPWVAFDAKSIGVTENVGTIEVNLCAYNITGPGTVTIKTSGTAVAGENFNIVGAESGVFNFTESGVKPIQIEIINHPHELAGTLTLTLEINSVSEGMEIGKMKTLTISIADYVPVDWVFVKGIWKAQDYDDGAPDGGVYPVQFRQLSDTEIALDNLWGGEETLTGTIAFDEESNTATMAFPARQTVIDATDYGFGNMLLIGVDDTGSWAWAPVKATVTATGIEFGPWNLVITAGAYAGYLYGGSYTTLMTR